MATIRVVIIGGAAHEQHRLQEYLTESDMTVHVAAGSGELGELLTAEAADVAIVDSGDAGQRGLLAAMQVRLSTRMGVILLVDRARRSDSVLALSLGIDHCLVRPVDLRELELHVRNLHRRLCECAASPRADLQRQPALDDALWCFDPARWTLAAPGGKTVPLSAAEFHLVRHLMACAGQIATREALQAALDRRRASLASRNLDMIVSRLRKKVQNACRQRLPIRSARGIGYVFIGPCRIAKEDTALPLDQLAANAPMSRRA